MQSSSMQSFKRARSGSSSSASPPPHRGSAPAPRRAWHAGAARASPPCALTPSSSASASEQDDDDEVATPGKAMRVERLLANLGYGKRKDCQTLVKRGRVLGKGGSRLKVGDKVFHEDVTLDGEPLDPPNPLHLMLHKPIGYVVTSPEDERVMDPTIYDLLPQRYGARKPFLSAVGRLDKDTSGLLLLTDDGTMVHRIKSPRAAVWKVYTAQLAEPLTAKQVTQAAKRFASGTLVLEGDAQPLLPAALAMVDDRTARLSICEGRYHQVRRMFASLGHEVVALHRSQVGGLLLPPDLARGEFRHLTQDELEVVFQGPTTDEVLGAASRPQAPGVQASPRAAADSPPAAPSAQAPASPQPAQQEEPQPSAVGAAAEEDDGAAQIAAGQERRLRQLSEEPQAQVAAERRLRRSLAFRRRASPSSAAPVGAAASSAPGTTVAPEP